MITKKQLMVSLKLLRKRIYGYEREKNITEFQTMFTNIQGLISQCQFFANCLLFSWRFLFAQWDVSFPNVMESISY